MSCGWWRSSLFTKHPRLSPPSHQAILHSPSTTLHLNQLHFRFIQCFPEMVQWVDWIWLCQAPPSLFLWALRTPLPSCFYKPTNFILKRVPSLLRLPRCLGRSYQSQSVLITNDSLQPLKLQPLQLKLLLLMHHHMRLHYRSMVRNNINNALQSWPMDSIQVVVLGKVMDRVNTILRISQLQRDMGSLSWWTVWLLEISLITIMVFLFPITLFTRITI